MPGSSTSSPSAASMTTSRSSMSPISWPAATFPRQSDPELGGTFGSMPALGSEVRREGRGDARERLLTAAYELFSQHGVQAVGVDAIIERSGVARPTMYAHFNSKQELVLSFLDRREQVWTRDWLQAESARRARTPREQLL